MSRVWSSFFSDGSCSIESSFNLNILIYLFFHREAVFFNSAFDLWFQPNCSCFSLRNHSLLGFDLWSLYFYISFSCIFFVVSLFWESFAS